MTTVSELMAKLAALPGDAKVIYRWDYTQETNVDLGQVTMDEMDENVVVLGVNQDDESWKSLEGVSWQVDVEDLRFYHLHGSGGGGASNGLETQSIVCKGGGGSN